ncbi:MAG: VCBS repeat-containing protein [Planctomycetes bacterium]|nr:VCBS repeat-containing protein [Planctomycetota bacterium]
MQFPNHAALSAAIVLVFSTFACAQITWTHQVGAVPGPVVMTEGCITADLDGDGDHDVVFANGYALSTAGTAALLPTLLINKFNLSLGFVDESAARLPAITLKATQVIAADLDRDGDLDLVFACNGPSQQRLYLNNGAGVFTDASAARLPGLSIVANCVVAGDVEQDGDLDLFFNDGATNGQLKLVLNNGLGFFSNVTATHLPVAPKSNQQDIVVCDIDNDWDLDVVNSGKSAGQQIFFNDGTGHYTMNNTLLPAGTTLTYETDVADLDGDGDLDLCYLSTSGFTDAVVRNNLIPSGTLSFTGLSSYFTGTNGFDDNEFVYADSDNDGDLDIVIGSLTAAQERLYVNNGAFSFASSTTGFSMLGDPTLDVACADINNDGKLDMVTAQGESGNFLNRLYLGSVLDTRSPRVVRMRGPEGVRSVGDSRLVQIVLHDSAVDDGETTVRQVLLSGSYAHRSGTTAFSVPMTWMGGFLWNATLPVPPGVVLMGSTVTWSVVATDHAGNVLTTTPRVFNVCGAEAYGPGGQVGGVNALSLSGTGAAAGQQLNLTWTGFPFDAGLMALATERAALPYFTGTVLIDPLTILDTLPAFFDGAGVGGLSVGLPAGPSLAGLRLDLQVLQVVAGAVYLSNGLELVICP